VLSIRFRYYMSAHEGASSYSKSHASSTGRCTLSNQLIYKMLTLALCFGLVIGWITYRTLRRKEGSAALSDIAGVRCCGWSGSHGSLQE
jgi:hypothetical protein